MVVVVAGSEFSDTLFDMHTRRLVKRSILGSRVYAPSPTGDGARVTGVVQAVKPENRAVSAAGARSSVYTVLMQDGSLKELSEEEIAAGINHIVAKGPLKSSLKVCARVWVCGCARVCEASRPAGSASLLLLCSVVQRLTPSCTERIERCHQHHRFIFLI